MMMGGTGGRGRVHRVRESESLEMGMLGMVVEYASNGFPPRSPAWVPPDPPPLKSIDEADETPHAALVLRLHPPSVERCLHAVYQVTSAHSLITCWTIILLNTRFVQQRDERESDMSKGF